LNSEYDFSEDRPGWSRVMSVKDITRVQLASSSSSSWFGSLAVLAIKSVSDRWLAGLASSQFTLFGK